eukprot:g2126.t1
MRCIAIGGSAEDKGTEIMHKLIEIVKKTQIEKLRQRKRNGETSSTNTNTRRTHHLSDRDNNGNCSSTNTFKTHASLRKNLLARNQNKKRKRQQRTSPPHGTSSHKDNRDDRHYKENNLNGSSLKEKHFRSTTSSSLMANNMNWKGVVSENQYSPSSPHLNPKRRRLQRHQTSSTTTERQYFKSSSSSLNKARSRLSTSLSLLSKSSSQTHVNEKDKENSQSPSNSVQKKNGSGVTKVKHSTSSRWGVNLNIRRFADGLKAMQSRFSGGNVLNLKTTSNRRRRFR